MHTWALCLTYEIYADNSVLINETINREKFKNGKNCVKNKKIESKPYYERQ